MSELTIDYGEAYVAGWAGGCKCGAVNCVSNPRTTAEAAPAEEEEGSSDEDEEEEQEGEGEEGSDAE